MSCQYSTCKFPSRKKSPITIKTTGPASERGGRGGIGGGGGGAAGVRVALAIFHLCVNRGRRLFWRRNIDNGGCRWRHGAEVTAAFHQFDTSKHKQNNWPRAIPARPVQVVNQRNSTNGHQDSWSRQAAMTVVAATHAFLPADEQPHAQCDQNQGPQHSYIQKPIAQIMEQK